MNELYPHTRLKTRSCLSRKSKTAHDSETVGRSGTWLLAAGYIPSTCPRWFRQAHMQRLSAQHMDMAWAFSITDIIREARVPQKPINRWTSSTKLIGPSVLSFESPIRPNADLPKRHSRGLGFSIPAKLEADEVSCAKRGHLRRLFVSLCSAHSGIIGVPLRTTR